MPGGHFPGVLPAGGGQTLVRRDGGASLFFAHAPFTQTAQTGARIPRSGAGLRPVWHMQLARANAQATIPLQTALPCRRAWSLEPSLPVPISNRLDLLVELAEQAGARTSRTEIVAARVLCCSRGTHLQQTL